MWAVEKNAFYTMLKSKKNQKIWWIKNKYYKKEEIPDVIDGVTVKDQELDNEFETSAITYGNVQLTRDEKSVMEMHPKYTIFDKVDAIDCEAEIEKAMAKIRWSRIGEKREENGGTTTERREERDNTRDAPEAGTHGRNVTGMEHENITQRETQPGTVMEPNNGATARQRSSEPVETRRQHDTQQGTRRIGRNGDTD